MKIYKRKKNLPYYGYDNCSSDYKNGEPCKNGAYFYIKYYKKGKRRFRVLCGMHSRKIDKYKLEKNPNQEQDKKDELKRYFNIVDEYTKENKKENKKGKVILNKMKMMRKIPIKEGYLNIFPNFRHQNRKDGFGCSSLSPMSLGPVTHNQPGLPSSKNIENYHQANKVFEEEVDIDGVINKNWYKTRLEFYNDIKPHRHKTTSKKKNRPLYSIHLDEDGNEKKYTYLQSRYFYCKQYEKLAKETNDFKNLQEKILNGTNLQILGYDAYPVTQELYKHYIDISKPFGHELVLYTLLTVEDINKYPWNQYYEANKPLYS